MQVKMEFINHKLLCQNNFAATIKSEGVTFSSSSSSTSKRNVQRCKCERSPAVKIPGCYKRLQSLSLILLLRYYCTVNDDDDDDAFVVDLRVVKQNNKSSPIHSRSRARIKNFILTPAH